MDLLALADPLERWLENDDWLRGVAADLGFDAGPAILERYGAATSWRIWLGPDIELEFTLAHPDWASTETIDPGTFDVVSKGMRPLVDKDGALQLLQAAVSDAR